MAFTVTATASGTTYNGIGLGLKVLTSAVEAAGPQAPTTTQALDLLRLPSPRTSVIPC